MKFAKQLDEDAIPEWKGNYFDYKVAKKKLKAVARAVRSVTNSSQPRFAPASVFRDVPAAFHLERNKKDDDAVVQRRATQPERLRRSSDTPNQHVHFSRTNNDDNTSSKPLTISERSPLKTAKDDRDPHPQRMVSYGSIIGSPPNDQALRLKRASTLELPGTAVASEDEAEPTALTSSKPQIHPHNWHPSHTPPQAQTQGSPFPQQTHRPATANPNNRPTHSTHFGTLPRRTNSVPNGRPFVKRMFSIAGSQHTRASHTNNDIVLEAYEDLDFRSTEFFLFLDKELLKIESFYKSKEDEATERLELLREQLHVMRAYRLQEILTVDKKSRHSQAQDRHASNEVPSDFPLDDQAHAVRRSKDDGDADHTLSRALFARPFAKSVDLASDAIDRVRAGHFGKTSKAMGDLGTPAFSGHWEPDQEQRDYSRKPVKDVPYRYAKRKMKLALAEFYRALELLKAYALMNRTAYRKINKKYDKTVNTHRKLAYMEDKINKANFVTSEVVDKLIAQVEDLYARYFERGNRKIAASKLRAKAANAGDYSGSVARTCALAGAGLVFALQGTVYGAHDIVHPLNIVHKLRAEYLLQLYAGYFLILLLAALFCLDAGLFNKCKVNYQFVFELDNRHQLNWLELFEIPAWLFFLFGLSMWLNFTHVGGEAMYLYWFVVLIGISVVFLFLPAPIIYHRARRWLLYSTWRLLAAGFYPVEFRDFFLGDMFCSLTYSMGNIELFFCLYARNWQGEQQCNSSHSRLLGFLTTLPGLWRAFQCLRRYRDTRNAFPHLANCAKYGATTLMYVTLSLYRMQKTVPMKALFIACATVNAVYCTFWDLFMDWSLGDLRSKPIGLRRHLGFRKYVWLYYLAIVADPIIRFNWIFYAIYTQDLQHSTLVAFFVGFSEVFRRGLWSLFRVENEHCANIAHSRASRDISLPYQFSETSSTEQLLETNKAMAKDPNGPQDSSEEDTGTDSRDESQKTTEIVEPASVLPDAPKSTRARAKGSFSGKPNGRPDTLSRPDSQQRRPPMHHRNSTSRSEAATPFGLLNMRRRGTQGEPPAAADLPSSDPERGEQQQHIHFAAPHQARGDNNDDNRLHRSDTNTSNGLVTSLQRIGETVRTAHLQDYQKRKKPVDKLPPEDSDDDDDDDDDDGEASESDR